MAYTFIKAKGRLSIFKDGEFDHQQFKSHWSFRDPEGYIAQLVKWDSEAAEDKRLQAIARRQLVDEYLALRAARQSHNQLSLL